jgi:biotin carboxyl carrier protein
MGSVERLTRVADGIFRVDVDGRRETVYVAGAPGDQWIFWNGRVYRGDFRDAGPKRRARARGAGTQALAAPMPATVVKLVANVGQQVKKGDTIVVLEAMKMELPIRAPADGTIAAVHCREGELVQADATLVELE